MNALLEIIVDLILTLSPWRSGHEDRSIVGESDLDRRARKLLIGVIATSIALALAIGAWIYFRK